MGRNRDFSNLEMGFISPSGEFLPCPFCEHEKMADDYLDIIEKELKEYEKLLKDIFPHPKENGEEYRQLAVKRLLASEIIKELPDKYKEGLVYILLNALKERKITQEKYDLLKEILNDN